ncbi:hypothetical protein BTVI_157348 [Pitangus sulphuratus]|nr:hypothetical protein BTVI_157348 [Pitangus sulphuratus]
MGAAHPEEHAHWVACDVKQRDYWKFAVVIKDLGKWVQKGSLTKVASKTSKEMVSKLRQGMFRLDIRKNFFTERAVMDLEQAAQESDVTTPGSVQELTGHSI